MGLIFLFGEVDESCALDYGSARVSTGKENLGKRRHKKAVRKNLVYKKQTLQKDGVCFPTVPSGDSCFLLCSSAKRHDVCEFVCAV